MAIFTILEKIGDKRKGSNDSDFNGYLEDYIETIEEGTGIHTVLKALFDLDNDLKIIVNCKMAISKESISNQIIRYKDVFKLDGNPIVCPYIVYSRKDDQERALLLTDESYIFAKGIYYCMTEPYNKFQEAKNDFVALSIDNLDLVCKVFNRLYTHRAGALQREIDHSYYSSYDESKDAALKIASKLKENAFVELKNSEDQEGYIRNIIVKWFLLKKFLYVQYMVNKDILNTKHEGNVKKQRNQAKLYSDEVAFISFSELWKSTVNKE